MSKDIGLGEDWVLGSRKGNVWVITRSLKSSTSVLRICILMTRTAQSRILSPNRASSPPATWQGPRHATRSLPHAASPRLDPVPVFTACLIPRKTSPARSGSGRLCRSWIGHPCRAPGSDRGDVCHPFMIPLLLTQVRSGQDGHCRAHRRQADSLALN